MTLSELKRVYKSLSELILPAAQNVGNATNPVHRFLEGEISLRGDVLALQRTLASVIGRVTMYNETGKQIVENPNDLP